MDNRELLAALVDSLAWPVAVSAVAVLFRHQIRDLFTRGLTRLKVGPIEASWAAAERLIPSEVRSHKPTEPPDPALTQTAAVSPRVAILERHDELLSRMTSEAAARGLRLEGSAGDSVEQAQSAGLIDETTARALLGLTVMRNLAAHAPATATDERVQEFLVLADGLEFALEHQLRIWDQRHSA